MTFALRRYPSQLTSGRRQSSLRLKAAIESVRESAFDALLVNLRSPGGLQAASGHALPFVEWVLNEATTKANPREFAQAYLDRATGLSTTPEGISALMFERWISSKSRRLFARFVETVIEKSRYLVIFEGPVDEREFEQMRSQTEEFVKDYKVLVAYGHRAEDGMVSDLTVLEAKPIQNLKPDILKQTEKPAQSAMMNNPEVANSDMKSARDAAAPKTEAQYAQVAEEGGLSSAAFTYVFGDPGYLRKNTRVCEDQMKVTDPNGVEWHCAYDSDRWLPVVERDTQSTTQEAEEPPSFRKAPRTSWQSCQTCAYFDPQVASAGAKPNGVCTLYDRTVEKLDLCDSWDGNETGSDESLEEKDDPCWPTHTMVGFKKKGKRKVPNCVPKDGVPKMKPKAESYEQFESGLLRSSCGSWAAFESPVEGGGAGTVVVAEKSAWLLASPLETVLETIQGIAACYEEPTLAWAQDRCIEHALAEWGSTEGRPVENIDECLAVAEPDSPIISERDDVVRAAFLTEAAPKAEKPAADEAPPEEEPTDRMDAPEFFRDDLQLYYDIQILAGVEPKEAVRKTKQRFGVKKLEVLPTGEVRSPDVTDRPQPPMPPMPGEPPLPAGPIEQPDGVPDTGTVMPESIEATLEAMAEESEDAEYDGHKVTLNKPSRIAAGQPGYGKKKFQVYVRNDSGNVVRVVFGDPDLEIKRDDPGRRANFRARHSCDDDPGPRWKARYWSCKMWQAGTSVGDMLGEVAPLVAKLASDTGKSEEEAERLWQKAGDLVTKNYRVKPESSAWYAIKVGIFKRMMGVAAESVRLVPSTINDAFHRWVRCDDGSVTEFEDWLRDNYPQFIPHLSTWTPDNIHEGREPQQVSPERMERYEKWRRLTNVPNAELRETHRNLAEVTTSISVGGIRTARLGAKSARRLLSMRSRQVEQWTEEDWEWAGRQINTISRLRATPGPLVDENGETEKLKLLRVWGHEPRTRARVSEAEVLVNQRSSWRCQSCHGLVFESAISKPDAGTWMHSCGARLTVPDADEQARRVTNRSIIDATPGTLPCFVAEGDQPTVSFDILRENREELSKSERAAVLRKKASVVYESRRHPLPAVWKATVGDQTYYVCNTHRAYAVSPTLAGAVAKYHAVIKPTS